MPVVTSDILELTLAGIKTEFDQAYIKRQEDADWKLISTAVPTTLPTQNYAWLGRGADALISSSLGSSAPAICLQILHALARRPKHIARGNIRNRLGSTIQFPPIVDVIPCCEHLRRFG